MIKLICIGKVKEPFVREGVNEFTKRLGAFVRFEVLEIKDSDPEKEAKDIISKIKNEKVFLLDEKGKEYSSYEFSELIKKESYDRDVLFIMGGPEGLSQELKRKYPSIALSKMTFTHEMARFFFVEQLYRAFTIMKNMKYHK